MITYKIKWKKYLLDLFLPKEKIDKIVILLPGLPKSSNPEKIINNFLEIGTLVICPQFSGSFDSAGDFSTSNCIKDIKEFIKLAKQKEVTELYFNKKIELGENNKIILAGMSFGAYIALQGITKEVDKLILLSPALIFNQKDINTIIKFDFQSQMNSLLDLLKKALPFSYRIKSYSDLKKFLHGQQENQRLEQVILKLNSLNIPTLCVHGVNDTSIPVEITKKIKNRVINKNISWIFTEAGHSTSSYNKKGLKIIQEFI